MINDFFDVIISMMVSLLRFLKTMWDAVGNFQPIFIAIFIGVVIFNFIVVPMLVFRRR